MRWVLDAAIEAGLHVRPQRYRRRYTLDEAQATQPRNRNSWKWALSGYKRRVIPAGACVHASVLTRMAHTGSEYHPQLPDKVTIVGGQEWLGPPATRS